MLTLVYITDLTRPNGRPGSSSTISCQVPSRGKLCPGPCWLQPSRVERVGEVVRCWVEGRILVVRIPNPTLFPDLPLRPCEHADPAHLPQGNAELLKEAALMFGETRHQGAGARVVQELDVGSEEAQAMLQILKVLVVEGQGGDGVHEVLDVLVEVWRFQDAVVGAIAQQLLAKSPLVFDVNFRVHSVFDALAVALPDGVRPCTLTSMKDVDREPSSRVCKQKQIE